ncbi:Rust resistance kinase Lr10 [Vitis vinifera]|uniref:Rust resistance kinase Lr10 n=1 Tax=Vitis vinifera TaxID=29760 RepID=A0A438I556_VITVI|nr:Rust resistance kinase Lr10 [Vitis vinifera]
MPQTKEASLSASELMMLREAKLVGVGLITLLHFSFLSFCAASENQRCRPSSCGDIQNISIPFRLKGDPLGCGHPDPAYELVCENNRTILYGKYYVEEINYITTPSEPIFDQYYIPIVPCNRTDATFSSSQPYAYALAGRNKQVRDLPYSCTIGLTVVTGNFMAVSEPSNLLRSDLQEKLLMGLQISFLSSRCHECKVKGRWCTPHFSNNTIHCNQMADDGRNFNTIRSPYRTQGRKDTLERSGYSGTVGIGTALIVPSLMFSLLSGAWFLETTARGTLGYIALELFYKNVGHVSCKADVYSFGMLLMEMVGKQRHFNRHHEEDLSELLFPSWIYDRIEQGEDMEMGDVTEDEKKYIWKMVIVALWCVQMKPMNRPMSKALDMLEGDVELLQLPPKPTLYCHEISALDLENKPMGFQYPHIMQVLQLA